MNEETKEQEMQEGVSLEYTEKVEEKGVRKEEIIVEKREEIFFSTKDIIKGFIFHELISKPISMRR